MATKIGNIGGPTKAGGVLSTREQFVKFAVYWPRASPFPDFWRQIENGTINWSQIGTELDQMKDELGINTVRVLTYYDHTFRNSEGAELGWTDGAGNHNPLYLGYLSTFVDMCADRDLDVLVTMYQLLPALKVADDWSFLEDDILHYESFHAWMLTMLGSKTNVHLYNLINEPDGYGVWDDVALAGRILTFLSRLKAKGRTVAPHLAAMINTSTHDNNFRRFPGAPPNNNSVYEVTDVLALNTFLWADTGYWAGQTYRTQADFINSRNIARKPVIMTECGHPSNYAQQGVAGSPIIDEDGVATGGNVVTTEESIVPQGGIFDRPKGVATGVAHTPENQARGVAEAAYWAFVSGWAGLGVWSAYDHRNLDRAYVYRDAFGVIDEYGNPLPAAGVFQGALRGVYDGNNEFRISLIQGTTSALPTRINGLGGWNASDTSANTIGGVYLAPSGGSWRSDKLIVGVPTKLRIDFNLRVANTHNEPLIIRLIAASRTFDFRYKVYGVSAWQRLDVSNGDLDYGFSQTSALTTGANSIIIDLSQGLAPRLTHNNLLLAFNNAPNGDLAFLAWQAVQLQIEVINSGNSAVDITKLTALGAAGTPIAFVPKAPRS